MISQMRNRHLTHGYQLHRHGGGRDRATTQRQDHFLSIQSRRQRFLNATSLNNEFRNGTGVYVDLSPCLFFHNLIWKFSAFDQFSKQMKE